jgi:hypothetical protein
MEVGVLRLGGWRKKYCWIGHSMSVEFQCFMILEWPHPPIDDDWKANRHQWREITPLAYSELRKVVPLRHETEDAFMQNEAVDILSNGDGLYVCCRKAEGYFFARLLPGDDWYFLEHLTLPVTNALC